MKKTVFFTITIVIVYHLSTLFLGSLAMQPVSNQSIPMMNQVPHAQQLPPEQQAAALQQLSSASQVQNFQQKPIIQQASGQRIPFIHEIPNAQRIPIQQTPLTNQSRQITPKAIDQFYNARFQKELKYVEAEYNKLKPMLEHFKNQLLAFSKQPLEYQKNYNNFQSLINSFEKIRQKHFAVSLIKLLQFKTATNPAPVLHVNKFVEALEKNVIEIEQMLETLASNENWKNNNFSNAPTLDPEKNMYDVFDEAILSLFPYRIRKIKHSITNWANVKN